METFMAALPDYLEGPGKDEKETGRTGALCTEPVQEFENHRPRIQKTNIDSG